MLPSFHNNNVIRVVELFAGVGGFRLGLEEASSEELRFDVVFSNQWEPSKVRQIASEIYVNKFGHENHSNQDISRVRTEDIPDHDLLVGGFPCQDYSVAKSLNQAHGIVGKKGVLWWEIHRIISEKENKPKFLLLENVDRLLKSPSKQRGRDFAIILASLADLGYAVEWRVINAADYGMPQRRRRVFFLAYHESSLTYYEIKNGSKSDWLYSNGIFANAFPVDLPDFSLFDFPDFNIKGDLTYITDNFKVTVKDQSSPFKNSGLMIERDVWTKDLTPNYQGSYTLLGDILIDDSLVPEEFYIKEESIPKWQYLKGAKDEQRVNKKLGYEYRYNEGAMVFPDSLDKPSRTIITGEGGTAPSRFKHVVRTKDGRLRRLTPIELERLNMFPDNHTQLSGVGDAQRAFFMGNALVVGIISRIASQLSERVLNGLITVKATY